MENQITEWHDCYGVSWKGIITDDSFAHPAKFSKSLIERIFDYCLKRGWLKRGDVVGDCFGGIGNGGTVAAYRGLRWIGVELEPKFVKMAQDNFELHEEKLNTMGLPLPKIVQGDSRKFHEVISCNGVVTSPPYNKPFSQDHNGSRNGGRANGTAPTSEDGAFITYGQTPGQIEGLKNGEVDAVISSPPYAHIAAGAGGLNTKPAKHEGQQAGRCAESASQTADQRYGQSPGQIAGLNEGTVEAVVTSPPYISGGHLPDQTGSWNTNGLGMNKGESGMGSKEAASYGQEEGQIGRLQAGEIEAVVTSPPFTQGYKGGGGINVNGYGDGSDKVGDRTYQGTGAEREEGNIEVLEAGTVDGVVTSPPFENQEGAMAKKKFDFLPTKGNGHGFSPEARQRQLEREQQKVYGESEGQIGNEQKETYWMAMKQVYGSCFLAIKPGGIIAVVVKDYVQNKKIVPLCDDTTRLLEHCGFTVIERVHAMLTKETRHNDLFNGETVTTKSRKSFFRRLAEKKGSPKIDWEEVIFCVKPL